jgi:arylsulfatase A-like enzyme
MLVRSRERNRTRLLVAALPALASLAGCSAPPNPSDLSLIWISIDTLRADHLGLYGYDRDTSPFMDELGRNGLYFDWVITPQNSTLPAHMTMFTGQHPIVHGVMHAKPGLRLADSFRTLPEILSREGFETRGWVDGGRMSAYFGFGRGFDEFDDERGPLRPKLMRAARWLRERDTDRRFLCLIHTYATHAPYNPPKPYAQRYPPASPSKSDRAMARYDGAIRFVDDQLRAFVGVLRTLDVLDRTILVVTSDHGEGFAEFGIDHIGHEGFNLHHNVTRVPWILVHPDPRIRGQVREAVGLIDFPNTMLALLGIPERLPGGGVDVLDSHPLASDTPRAYLSWNGPGQLDDRSYDAWSLYQDGYHLLRSDLATPSRNALYHVASDPRETRPLDSDERWRAMELRLEQMRRAYEGRRTLSRGAPPETGTLPARIREDLRALGYLE